MAEETERRRSPLPAGWLDHREFLRRVGKLIEPGWTGTEHVAFAPDWPNELATIDADAAIEAYRRQVEAGIAQARAEPPASVSGALCAVCGAPANRIMDGRDYCAIHGEAKPIPEHLRARLAATASEGAITPTTSDAAAQEAMAREAMAAAGRDILLKELTAAYEERERPAWERWRRVHAVVRDAVLGGKLAPGIWCHHEVHWPLPDELLTDLRKYYPGPHPLDLLRVELPGLPMPGWVAFREADVISVKPAEQRNKVKGKRGPKSNKTQLVADRMLEALKSGKITTDELLAEKAMILGSRYGCALGETAAREARRRALTTYAQFRAKEMPRNAK